jgi:PAS domain S-box-containing protein
MNSGVEILIVEDSPAQARHLKQLLEKHAYQVFVAHNGEEALAATRRHAPTLVISDIVMPYMDGFELCRQIKADANLKDLPVVLLTQLSDPSDIVEGLECGADNFMIKPYDERTLLSRIQYILANQTLRRDAISEMGLEIYFAGKKHFITAGRMQIIDLLLSTYESAVQKSRELQQANTRLITVEHELRAINEQLQQEVAGRVQAEQALQEAHDELEARAEQRTTELKKANEALRVEVIERRRAEEELRRVNRALRVLSECNQAVVRATEESALLQQVCQLLVETGGYRLAWVGFAEQDRDKTVRPVAQAGFEEGYLQTLGITWADTERGRGPTGTAIRTGEPAMARNILTDPNFAPWRAEATRRGYASSIALPLTANSQILGALNIYAVEPDAFDAEEEKLLTELANDLAYGIVALRTRAERQRTEEALRESEARHRALVDSADDVIFSLDRDGRYTAINASTLRRFGWTEADFVGKSIRDFYPPEEAAFYEEQHAKVIETGQPVHFERHSVNESGEFWFSITLSPILDPAGKVVGIVGVSRDVTARKRVEEGIQRRNRELVALNRLAQQVSASLSMDQVMAAALDEVATTTAPDLALIFLRERGRLLLRGIGPRDSPFAHRETPEHRVGECLCRLADSQGQPIYSSDVHRDPRCTWEECKKAGLRSFAALPLRSGDDGVGVLGLGSATERDFEEQAGFLETLASEVAIGVQNAHLYEQGQRHWRELSMLHSTSQVLARSLNPAVIGQRLIEAMESLFSYEYGAVLAVDEPTQELVPLALSDQQQGPEFVVQDKEYVRSKRLRVGQGIVGWVIQHGQAVRLSDVRQDPRYFAMREDIRSELCVPLVVGGKVIGALNVETSKSDAYDEEDERLLTALAGPAAVAIENARLYEQIREHAATLERRVAERTAELQVATEKAQAADRLKSAFLATMSHELRTPLNSIIGFTGIMLQGLAGPLNDEQTRQLRMVQSSARHLLALINDILDISKIEAGQLEVASESFNMRKSIETIVRAVTPLAEKKGLALVAEVAPEVGQIVSDRRRVEQILINLVNNAVKFTEQGEVHIVCEVSDAWLVTRVIDTGIGIRPEDMDKLFEPFRQIEHGLTRRHEGTGLGLSICKRLVEMLGGEIWAESEWGVGSTFTFTLPRDLLLRGALRPSSG